MELDLRIDQRRKEVDSIKTEIKELGRGRKKEERRREKGTITKQRK